MRKMAVIYGVSVALVVGLAACNWFWDELLCADDGPADYGISSATSYCHHWDSHDLGYPPLTWIAPSFLVLLVGGAAVATEHRRVGMVACVVACAGVAAQAALLLRSVVAA